MKNQQRNINVYLCNFHGALESANATLEDYAEQTPGGWDAIASDNHLSKIKRCANDHLNRAKQTGDVDDYKRACESAIIVHYYVNSRY